MSDAPRLTHLDARGEARMVGVGHKPPVARRAVAEAVVRMRPESARAMADGTLPKGDAAAVARVAGIMAAKRTPDLIPLCHPLALTGVTVTLTPDEARSIIAVRATVRCTGVTGVEMEALTAASVAALTIYDMCKAVDRGMRIDNVRLLRKSGGRSGEIVLENEQ